MALPFMAALSFCEVAFRFRPRCAASLYLTSSVKRACVSRFPRLHARRSVSCGCCAPPAGIRRQIETGIIAADHAFSVPSGATSIASDSAATVRPGRPPSQRRRRWLARQDHVAGTVRRQLQ